MLPKRRYLEVAFAKTATDERLVYQRNIPTALLVAESYHTLAALFISGETESWGP